VHTTKELEKALCMKLPFLFARFFVVCLFAREVLTPLTFGTWVFHPNMAAEDAFLMGVRRTFSYCANVLQSGSYTQEALER
jgi:hypothetical protein